MMLKLFHYAHCPYCVRVRLAFGFLNVKYETELVAYDDEKTPTQLIGTKMLPIVIDEQARALGESLDIIAQFDIKNYFHTSGIKESAEFKKFDDFLNNIGKPIQSLCMPYWIYTKEFSEPARNYFQKKKEVKRGPFSQLVKNRQQFEIVLKPFLTEIEYKLNPYYMNDELSLYDIMLASHLWGLYIVPEFQFSPKLHAYLQNIKQRSNFNYQQDFWK